MIGRPPCCCSKVALASSRSSPPTTTRLNTGRHCGWKRRQTCSGVSLRVGALDRPRRPWDWSRAAPACPRASAPGRWSAAGWPGRSGRTAATSSFTRWKVSLAVWLILRLRSVVSLMPGTCSRMRSSPWRTMVGSMVPVSSTRRRRISIDWSITSFLRRNRSWSEKASWIVSPLPRHGERGIDGADRLDRLGALRLVAQGDDHGAAALHSHVLEADLLLAQLGAHRIGKIGQAFVQHRAQVGFQQEVGAAAQVEAEIDAALLIPARQVVEHGGRQHVGQREQRRQRRDGDDSDDSASAED